MQYFERNWFLFCVLKCKTVWRPVYCVASSGDRDIVPLLLKHDLTCRMIIDRIFFYHFWFLIHCFFFPFCCLNVDIACFLLRYSFFISFIASPSFLRLSFLDCFSLFPLVIWDTWLFVFIFVCFNHFCLFCFLPFAIFQYYYAPIRFFYY